MSFKNRLNICLIFYLVISITPVVGVLQEYPDNNKYREYVDEIEGNKHVLNETSNFKEYSKHIKNVTKRLEYVENESDEVVTRQEMRNKTIIKYKPYVIGFLSDDDFNSNVYLQNDSKEGFINGTKQDLNDVSEEKNKGFIDNEKQIVNNDNQEKGFLYGQNISNQPKSVDNQTSQLTNTNSGIIVENSDSQESDTDEDSNTDTSDNKSGVLTHFKNAWDKSVKWVKAHKTLTIITFIGAIITVIAVVAAFYVNYRLYKRYKTSVKVISADEVVDTGSYTKLRLGQSHHLDEHMANGQNLKQVGSMADPGSISFAGSNPRPPVGTETAPTTTTTAAGSAVSKITEPTTTTTTTTSTETKISSHSPIITDIDIDPPEYDEPKNTHIEPAVLYFKDQAQNQKIRENLPAVRKNDNVDFDDVCWSVTWLRLNEESVEGYSIGLAPQEHSLKRFDFINGPPEKMFTMRIDNEGRVLRDAPKFQVDNRPKAIILDDVEITKRMSFRAYNIRFTKPIRNPFCNDVWIDDVYFYDEVITPELIEARLKEAKTAPTTTTPIYTPNINTPLPAGVVVLDSLNEEALTSRYKKWEDETYQLSKKRKQDGKVLSEVPVDVLEDIGKELKNLEKHYGPRRGSVYASDYGREVKEKWEKRKQEKLRREKKNKEWFKAEKARRRAEVLARAEAIDEGLTRLETVDSIDETVNHVPPRFEVLSFHSTDTETAPITTTTAVGSAVSKITEPTTTTTTTSTAPITTTYNPCTGLNPLQDWLAMHSKKGTNSPCTGGQDPQVWLNGNPITIGPYPPNYIFNTIQEAYAVIQSYGEGGVVYTIMLENNGVFKENLHFNCDVNFGVLDDGTGAKKATICGKITKKKGVNVCFGKNVIIMPETTEKAANTITSTSTLSPETFIPTSASCAFTSPHTTSYHIPTQMPDSVKDMLGQLNKQVGNSGRADFKEAFSDYEQKKKQETHAHAKLMEEQLKKAALNVKRQNDQLKTAKTNYSTALERKQKAAEDIRRIKTDTDPKTLRMMIESRNKVYSMAKTEEESALKALEKSKESLADALEQHKKAKIGLFEALIQEKIVIDECKLVKNKFDTAVAFCACEPVIDVELQKQRVAKILPVIEDDIKRLNSACRLSMEKLKEHPENDLFIFIKNIREAQGPEKCLETEKRIKESNTQIKHLEAWQSELQVFKSILDSGNDAYNAYISTIIRERWQELDEDFVNQKHEIVERIGTELKKVFIDPAGDTSVNDQIDDKMSVRTIDTKDLKDSRARRISKAKEAYDAFKTSSSSIIKVLDCEYPLLSSRYDASLRDSFNRVFVVMERPPDVGVSSEGVLTEVTSSSLPNVEWLKISRAHMQSVVDTLLESGKTVGDPEGLRFWRVNIELAFNEAIRAHHTVESGLAMGSLNTWLEKDLDLHSAWCDVLKNYIGIIDSESDMYAISLGGQLCLDSNFEKWIAKVKIANERMYSAKNALTLVTSDINTLCSTNDISDNNLMILVSQLKNNMSGVKVVLKEVRDKINSRQNVLCEESVHILLQESSNVRSASFFLRTHILEPFTNIQSISPVDMMQLQRFYNEVRQFSSILDETQCILRSCQLGVIEILDVIVYRINNNNVIIKDNLWTLNHNLPQYFSYSPKNAAGAH